MSLRSASTRGSYIACSRRLFEFIRCSSNSKRSSCYCWGLTMRYNWCSACIARPVLWKDRSLLRFFILTAGLVQVHARFHNLNTIIILTYARNIHDRRLFATCNVHNGLYSC